MAEKGGEINPSIVMSSRVARVMDIVAIVEFIIPIYGSKLTVNLIIEFDRIMLHRLCINNLYFVPWKFLKSNCIHSRRVVLSLL